MLGAAVRSLLVNWKEYEFIDVPIMSSCWTDDTIVGRLLGLTEGLEVGGLLGLTEGLQVGILVGSGVGLDVGTVWWLFHFGLSFPQPSCCLNMPSRVLIWREAWVVTIHKTIRRLPVQSQYYNC